MRLDRQSWILVVLAGLLALGSFLPWLGEDSAWSLRFAPLVIVVHIPAVAAIVLATLIATEVIGARLPLLDDRQWLRVAACYALVGSVMGLLLQRTLLARLYGGIPTNETSAGAGAFITIAAAVALFVVTIFGDRISFLRDVTPVASASGTRWIYLTQTYQSPEGDVLLTDEWYLAFDDAGAVVVQLDNGTEIELPRGFPIEEAP